MICLVENKSLALCQAPQVSNDLGQRFGLGVVGRVFLGVGMVNKLAAAVDKGDFFEVGVALGVDNQVAHGGAGSRDANVLNILV